MADDVVVPGNTRSIDWGPAIWASLIAGVVFAVLEIALAWAVKGQSPWAPLHMIGAIGLGPDALTPPDTFDVKIISTAVVIHFALAILYGVILAFIVQRMETTWAILVGGLYGLALYLINFYGFTRLFPWFPRSLQARAPSSKSLFWRSWLFVTVSTTLRSSRSASPSSRSPRTNSLHRVGPTTSWAVAV